MAFGFSILEAWEQQHPDQATLARLSWALGSVVFLFGPVLVFVFGYQHLSPPGNVWWRTRHPHHPKMRDYRRRYWSDYAEVCLRTVSWFLGFAIAVVLYSVARNGHWPV
jgi:hypothetical protein